MRPKGIAYIAIAGAMLLSFGAVAFAQSGVTVKFTGSDTGSWDGDDAGIYGATMNGSSSSGMISDDYNNQISSGESWKANAYQASQLTAIDPSTGMPYLDDTLFGSKIGFAGYAEMAMLVSAMFSGNSTVLGISGLTQAELTSVIWDIGTGGKLTLSLDLKSLALYLALQVYFATHSATAYLNSMTNLWILTPQSSSGAEMWAANMSVPEGGAALLYLLFAGGTCFGGLYMQKNKLQPKRVRTSARLL
jgi:hypothetical protein